MADQTTKFGIQADTSAVDKLSSTLKELDSGVGKLTTTLSNFNKLNRESPKYILEVIDSARDLDAKLKQLVVTEVNVSESHRKFVETGKALKEELTRDKSASDELNKSLKERPTPAAGGGGVVGPPAPPVATGGIGPGAGDPGNRAFNLQASIRAINDILAQLGINLANITDQGAFERLRSKVNALAQAAGGGSAQAVRTLGDALGRIETRNFDPVTGNLRKTIDAIQALEREAKKAAEQQERLSRISAAPGIVSGAVTQLGGTPEALARLSPDSAARVRAEIDRLNATLAKSPTASADVEAALRRLQSGSFEPLSGSAKSVYINLQRINDILKEEASSAQRAAGANELIKQALSGLGISERAISGLDPGRAQTARVAINNLAAAMISGKVSAEDLNRAVQSFNTRGVTALTGGAAIAAAQLGNLKTVTSQNTSAIGEAFSRFTSILNSVIIRRALFALSTAVRNAYIEVGKFETAINRTGLSAELNESQIGKLRETIASLATTTGKVRLDIAAGGLELFRNKTLDSANATDLLQDAINLSIVTFSTTEEAAKALSNTIGEFGLKASDVGRTSKLLFAGVTAGRVDLKDIENVLGGTSIAANQLGVSLEEVIASFVSLRDQGVPAGKATATLNLLFNRLVQSTPELNAVFGRLGFESAQAAVRALGLEGVLKVISEEAKNGAGRIKAFGDALLGNDPNISKISASLTNLEKDVKRFDSALEQINNSQQRRFEKAAASFRGGLTTIADASKKLVVIYVEGIDAVVKFLTRFEESKVGEAVAKQIKDIKAAQEETTTSAERENKKTLESYEGLFANIRKNALDTLSELRNRFQNNSVLVEENFKTLSEIVKKISTDANNTIKQAQRDIVSFAQDIEKRSFEKRIQILPPAQQFQELQERLNSLIASGEEFARQNKRQEAQGAFKEAESILLKFEDINNKITQQQGNIARATDRNFRQHLINIDKVLGSQSKLGRENQRDLEQQLNILRRYAQAYNEPAVRANALAEIAARQLALRQRTALQGLQQDQAALSRNAIDTEKRVQVAEDTGIRRIKGLQEQQKTLQDQLSQQRLKVTEIPKDIDTQLESLRKAGPSLQGVFDKPFQRLIDRSKEALQTFTETPNEVTFKQLGNTIDDVLNRFAKHPRITKEFQDNIDAIRTSLTGLSGGRESVSELNNKLAVVNEQLSEAKTQAPIASGEIARSFESAAFSSKNLIDNVVGFNSALSESIQKVDQLTLKLSVLGTIAPTVPNIQFPSVAPTAPPVEYFGRQHGGLIGGNPGIDNNLVRVSRGEYIVNADSTKRFYPQLVAMNTGRLPGFQHGGLVSNTTVGNITVNVTAQSTEQANIRQIGQALNREIRRGTLRFGG